MANSDLPDEILHKILARLPGKSLVRFRSVSKHWNRLVSEPYFMKSRSQRMIIVSTSSLDLHLIDDNAPVTAADITDSIVNLFGLRDQKGSKLQVTVVGTFNGIVLLGFSSLSQTTDMILYNPLTRAWKKVPNPPSPFNHVHASGSSYAFGFGYGATNPDDLKIVKIEVHSFGHSGTYHVFDLKKSVWSTPHDFIPTYEFHDGMAGVFLNGFLYWVAYRSFKKVILALNVEETVFSNIDLPSRCDSMTDFLLGSLNGCLCMMSRDSRCNKFDVWVMKKQGVENSWSKVYSFEFHLDMDSYYWHPSCIYSLDQGRILMRDSHGKLYIYDISKDRREYSRIRLKESDEKFRLHGIEYVESLVSPSDILGD